MLAVILMELESLKLEIEQAIEFTEQIGKKRGCEVKLFLNTFDETEDTPFDLAIRYDHTCRAWCITLGSCDKGAIGEIEFPDLPKISFMFE